MLYRKQPEERITTTIHHHHHHHPLHFILLDIPYMLSLVYMLYLLSMKTYIFHFIHISFQSSTWIACGFILPFPLSKCPGLGCCYNTKLTCSLFPPVLFCSFFYFYYTLCIIFHTFPSPHHHHYFWYRMARQVNLILLFQKNKCQKYTSHALALMSCPACCFCLSRVKKLFSSCRVCCVPPAHISSHTINNKVKRTRRVYLCVSVQTLPTLIASAKVSTQSIKGPHEILSFSE